MFENFQSFVNVMGYSSLPASLLPWLLVLVAWLLIWKGIALWKAAKSNSKPWFIALLLINTVGILEIIYIFFVSKKNKTI